MTERFQVTVPNTISDEDWQRIQRDRQIGPDVFARMRWLSADAARRRNRHQN